MLQKDFLDLRLGTASVVLVCSAGYRPSHFQHNAQLVPEA